MNSNDWYVAQARKVITTKGTIEIDDNAVVSNGSDPGAYVKAWVWEGDVPATE